MDTTANWETMVRQAEGLEEDVFMASPHRTPPHIGQCPVTDMPGRSGEAFNDEEDLVTQVGSMAVENFPASGRSPHGEVAAGEIVESEEKDEEMTGEDSIGDTGDHASTQLPNTSRQQTLVAPAGHQEQGKGPLPSKQIPGAAGQEEDPKTGPLQAIPAPQYQSDNHQGDEESESELLSPPPTPATNASRATQATSHSQNTAPVKSVPAPQSRSKTMVTSSSDNEEDSESELSLAPSSPTPNARRTTETTSHSQTMGTAQPVPRVERSLDPDFGSKRTLHGSLSSHVQGITNMVMTPPAAVR